MLLGSSRNSKITSVIWNKHTNSPNPGNNPWEGRIAIDGFIYFIGGNSRGTAASKQIRVFDIENQSWNSYTVDFEIFAQPNIGLWEDNQIWANIGFDGTSLQSMFNKIELTPTSATLLESYNWNPPLDSRKCGGRLFKHPNKDELINLCGDIGEVINAPTLHLNTVTKVTTVGTSANIRSITPVVVDGVAYILGGNPRTVAGVPSNQVTIYNLESRSLAVKPVTLPVARGSHGTVLLNEEIFMLGGFSIYDSRHLGTRVVGENALQAFDIKTDTFRNVPSINTPIDKNYTAKDSLFSYKGDLYFYDGADVWKGVPVY